MRILRYLLISIAIIVSVSVLTFFVAREALLTWSVWGVKDALGDLQAAAVNPVTHSDKCTQFRVSNAQLARVQSVELTFVNDRKYQLQIVCEDYAYQPVVLKQYELGPLVTKVPGSAGFVWSETIPTMVSVQLWGRTQTITLNNGKVTVTQGLPLVNTTLSPKATCQGFGYQCCNADSTQGAGSSATGATDCPRTCFAQCLVRPVVLSLNTQPFYDPATRTVAIQSGQDVLFNFTTNLSPDKVKATVLEFGDGQVYQTASPSGEVSHTYVCTDQMCEYQSRLIITDTQNLSNPTNAVSQVKVMVTP